MCFAHVGFGLCVARRVKSLPVVFCGCVALHFMCDAVPHWNPSLSRIDLNILDLSLAGLLLGFFGNLDWRTGLAALGSILPDIALLTCPHDLFFMRLHHGFKFEHISPFWGVLLQVVLLAIALTWTFHFKRKSFSFASELSSERV